MGIIISLHKCVKDKKRQAKALKSRDNLVTYSVLIFGITLRVLLCDFGHNRIRNHVTGAGYDFYVGTVDKFGQRVLKNK